LFPDSVSRENLLPEFNGKLRRSQLQVAEGFFHFLVMLRITRQDQFGRWSFLQAQQL
jgi:hypothetical protein